MKYVFTKEKERAIREAAAGVDAVLNKNTDTGVEFWVGTQGEYDSLENVDENTVYLIKE